MGKWSFPSYLVELGEHPVPGEHLSSHWGEGRRGGDMGMELQGSREQNLGQQGKPGAEEESRDARRQKGTVGGSSASGRMCSSKRGSAGRTHGHRDLEGDVTSKVARSPDAALLGLFSPGPEGCISAQLVKDVRATPLPSACDLRLAGTRGCKCRIPDEHRTCRRPRARCQNPPPVASSDPVPFPAQGLLAEGATAKPSCKSSVVK